MGQQGRRIGIQAERSEGTGPARGQGCARAAVPRKIGLGCIGRGSFHRIGATCPATRASPRFRAKSCVAVVVAEVPASMMRPSVWSLFERHLGEMFGSAHAGMFKSTLRVLPDLRAQVPSDGGVPPAGAQPSGRRALIVAPSTAGIRGGGGWPAPAPNRERRAARCRRRILQPGEGNSRRPPSDSVGKPAMMSAPKVDGSGRQRAPPDRRTGIASSRRWRRFIRFRIRSSPLLQLTGADAHQARFGRDCLHQGVVGFDAVDRG